MKLSEARSLYHRVQNDLLAAQEAVNLAIAALRRDLIVPNNPEEGTLLPAGRMLDVEQEFDSASRAVGVLKRSLEVTSRVLYEARKEAETGE